MREYTDLLHSEKDGEGCGEKRSKITVSELFLEEEQVRKLLDATLVKTSCLDVLRRRNPS